MPPSKADAKQGYDLEELTELAIEDLEHTLQEKLPLEVRLRIIFWLARAYDAGRR